MRVLAMSANGSLGVTIRETGSKNDGWGEWRKTADPPILGKHQTGYICTHAHLPQADRLCLSTRGGRGGKETNELGGSNK